MDKYKGYAGFIETRYPYTYAYDVLRMLNPLGGGNGRSDQAAWVTEHCKSAGVDKEKFCSSLAAAYLDYELALSEAEKARSERVSNLLLSLEQ